MDRQRRLAVTNYHVTKGGETLAITLVPTMWSCRRPWLAVLVSICLLLEAIAPSAQDFSAAALFRHAIPGVVWIENYLPNGGVSFGSGFLVSRQRRLVVTNYHVAGGEATMGVYFPVRDSDGRLISDRNYYQQQRAKLRESGDYNVGWVVAQAPDKDLAILRLSELPQSAVALPLKIPSHKNGDVRTDIRLMDVLHVLGNPGGRDLWQWGAVIEPEFSRFRGTYEGYPVAMNYASLTFSSNVFGGNSGGPVLDRNGDVVGVLSARGGEGGMFARAVHYAEIYALLMTIKSFQIFSVTNTGRETLSYQIRWNDQEWKDMTVGSGDSLWHSYECAIADVFSDLGSFLPGYTYKPPCSARPQIRFDSSLVLGLQLKQYDLNTNIADLGPNVKPHIQRDAKQYEFRWRSDSTLDLYQK